MVMHAWTHPTYQRSVHVVGTSDWFGGCESGGVSRCGNGDGVGRHPTKAFLYGLYPCRVGDFRDKLCYKLTMGLMRSDAKLCPTVPTGSDASAAGMHDIFFSGFMPK